MLDTFKIHDEVTEQSQMMIEFMSLVDTEEGMLFKFIFKRKMCIYLFFSKTEIWSLNENNDAVNIKITEPVLNHYATYPELFIVDSDFCTKK